MRLKQPRGPRRIVLLKQHVRFPAMLKRRQAERLRKTDWPRRQLRLKWCKGRGAK